ncbi:serine/arginine-rich SC35-like splicing factor SCL30A [Bidens hawaiensis]|uniref:serine/arginine-rich SC35-like splicing factor SCL30A n=1 Tax=Bidens hawaiensis TaxID=980011 RepID=UPI00404930F8
MGRHERYGRSRSRSYSPPPRRRYDDQRVRRYDDHRHRRSPPPSGLLVRNISLDSRPEDLRIHFERFGPVKDVYLPKNYYTGEPRGFGFVKFRNPEDAAEAKHELNHCVIGGREIAIVFAEENRKTPREMRTTSQMSGRYGGGSGARRTPPRFSRRRSHSRSFSPVRREYSDRGRNVYSRSPPPHDDGDGRTYKSRRASPRKNGRGSMYTDQRGGSHEKLEPSPAQDWKSYEAAAGGGRLSRSRSRSPPHY